MSSCLSGGGPAYGFDLDIVKSSSSSSSARSSSPSSTLSESSNSPVTISIKKPRAPRKRPNQTYNEAAALLSTVYPKIFSTKNLVKISKQTIPFDGFHESSELLPPIPVLSDAAFLIREPSPEKPSLRINSKATNSLDDKSSPISPSLVSNESSSPALSTVSNEMWESNSPDPLEDDFDAQSILDEKVEEGIDSIMGNLCMSTNSTTNSNEDSLLCNSITNPYIQNLMGLGLGSELYLGLRFRYRGVMLQALKHRDDGCCWSSPTVPMKDILPKLKVSTPPSDKKKKKAKKEEVVDMPSSATASTTQAQGRTKAGLGLKLNHEEILKAWSDHGSMFADGAESSNYSADALAKLTNIDLSPENGAVGGVREACVMRYKEKRRTRLFSKKIRYQVRKVNADQRPRMKASGRFVKRPSLLQEAIDEESP